ncbi:hypothetical protein G4B88_002177 [Cannabis sativa]|uniref:Reverse transcriptase zinc-binding domain-containing protein n=1 Tax=Cannabis sativa TaxID=3483 RepID=A0A7J6EI08_CANSA|nr:hypothetical protein G4B88_002177 [Cannabis sativa]
MVVEVLHGTDAEGECGPSTGPFVVDKGKGIAEVDNEKIKHLAMVFKASLDPKAQPAHKASRPIRSLGKTFYSLTGSGKNNATLSGPGKKRRLNEIGDITLDHKADNSSIRSGSEYNGVDWFLHLRSPRREHRREFWDNLGNTMKDFASPWMVMGDLNSVLKSKEKSGGRPNCLPECRKEFCDLLGFAEMKGDEKFLGNPLLFKSNRSSDFDYIIEKISSRLEGWRANLLSQAARMTLIKSVLASIPIYTMSVFLLPRKITNRIDASLRQFWWTGSSKEGRYLSLKAWDSLCKPKACGGLGFRRARDINFSLISKLGWLLISDGNSLWTTVVNAKYCQVEGFFSTPQPSKASLVVRGIWATRDFIRQNSIWIIGQDSEVNVWDYHWSCGNGIQYDAGVLNPKIKGIDLSGWDRRRLSAYFTPEATNSLISVDRRLLADSDSVYWKSSSDGKFSLKVAYWDLNKEIVAEKDEMCSLIWKSKLHECLKLFLWKLCCDVLPFGSRLQSIFGKTPDPCMLCGQSEGDDVHHFLSICTVTQHLWFASQ